MVEWRSCQEFLGNIGWAARCVLYRILELVGVVASAIAALSLFYGAAERQRGTGYRSGQGSPPAAKSRAMPDRLASLAVWFLWQLAFAIL